MDATELTVGLLQEAFESVPVSTELPMGRQNAPERLVVVTLAGGPDDGFLAMPLMGITCYGATDRDAFNMAKFAADTLAEAAEDHPYLSAAENESISRDEWTTTGQARYYALVRLYINTDEE